ARFDAEAKRFHGMSIRPTRVDGGLGFEVAHEDGSAAQTIVAPFALGRMKIEQFMTVGSGGRLQPMPIAYDTDAHEWFDTDPDEASRSRLHDWASREAAANTQCLVCHTTGYDKGYRAGSDDYQTRWAEMGVGCET